MTGLAALVKIEPFKPADPNCPDCKGRGSIDLFISTQICNCVNVRPKPGSSPVSTAEKKIKGSPQEVFDSLEWPCPNHSQYYFIAPRRTTPPRIDLCGIRYHFAGFTREWCEKHSKDDLQIEFVGMADR